MGILYYDKGILENVLHQIKVRLNKISSYQQIFNDRREFVTYLDHKLQKARDIILIICSNVSGCLIDLVKEKLEHCRVRILILENKLLVQSNSIEQEKVMNYLNKEFATVSTDISATESCADEETPVFNDFQNRINVESLSISVFDSGSHERTFRYLSLESLKFLLHQTFTEVIISMEHQRQALDEMLHWCRGYYCRDPTELQKIDQFKELYVPSEAIHYYTQDSFVFRRVNQAFRLEDLELIFRCRIYVTDLHHQIIERAESRPISPIKLYRGKKLPSTILQQLSDNLNKPISINGFLSTTQNITVAKGFAGVGQDREGYESVLFELNIDNNRILTIPVVHIDQGSMDEGEQEVLFSVGSVWLLNNVQWVDGYWLIELQSCDILDSQLTEIKQLAGGCTFLSLGHIARELGEYSAAANFYRRMLQLHPSDVEIRRLVYFYLGLLNDELGDYMNALDNYLKAEQLLTAIMIIPDLQPSDSQPFYASDLLKSKAHIWNNIGRSYERKGDYESARQYYTKALNEQGDVSEKTIVYYNLGLFEFQQGNFEIARGYFMMVIKAESGHRIMGSSRQHLKVIDELFRRGVAADDN